MRWLVGAILVVCACGKKAEPPGDAMKIRVPKVESAAVMAAPPATDKVPIIAFIDDTGGLGIAVAPDSWSALGEHQPPAKLVTVDATSFWPLLYESVMLDRTPQAIVDDFKLQHDEVTVDLAVLEDTTARSSTTAVDDPPPPEEDDKPDDGEDESRGSGTAMTIEEGKMTGRPEPERAEGQYKMKRNTAADDDAARTRRAHPLPGPRGHRSRIATGGDYPGRLATIAGVIEDAPMKHQQIAIAARPGAKAAVVIDALTRTQAALLVAHGADVRPLRLLFSPATPERTTADPAHWVEVRVTTKELVVEVVPRQPIVVQPAGLAAAYKQLAASDAASASVVDVLVAPDVDTQRLVDVLAALDAGGARAIALGLAPSGDDRQAKLRGKRIVRYSVGQPTVMGPLDKAAVRRVVSAAVPQLRACYERGLAAQPDLPAGTISATFVIGPTGKVASGGADGISTDVSTCTFDALKTLSFPPDNEKTQVSLPLTIR